MTHPKWLAWIDRRLTPARFTFALCACYVPWVAYNLWSGPDVAGPRRAAPEVADDAGTIPAALRDEIDRIGTPAQRALVAGTFKRGDSLEAFVAAHPPSMLIRHPPYATLWYGPHFPNTPGVFVPIWPLEVIAKDGILIEAAVAVRVDPQRVEGAQIFGYGMLGLLLQQHYYPTLGVRLDHYRDDARAALMAATGGAVAGGWR